MEVKLWNDKREREMYDDFAELFAIIKAMEKIEKAFASDYETECCKLISQFKTLYSTLKDSVPNIQLFHDTYKMDCSAALNRLVISGVPATVEHRAIAATSEAVVAECVKNFITAMDSLKVTMVAVNHSLNKLSVLSADFEGKTKMREWLLSLLLIVMVLFVSFLFGMRIGY